MKIQTTPQTSRTTSTTTYLAKNKYSVCALRILSQRQAVWLGIPSFTLYSSGSMKTCQRQTLCQQVPSQCAFLTRAAQLLHGDILFTNDVSQVSCKGLCSRVNSSALPKSQLDNNCLRYFQLSLGFPPVESAYYDLQDHERRYLNFTATETQLHNNDINRSPQTTLEPSCLYYCHSKNIKIGQYQCMEPLFRLTTAANTGQHQTNF